MKRKWLLIPALLLAVAVTVTLSCPSQPDTDEPEPGDILEEGEYDFIIKGGEGSYQYQFDTPRIEQGKTYVVTFTIENCDKPFVGNRMGGKINYKQNFDDTTESAKVLSGWAYCAPEVITGRSGTFRWTFKAGEKNKDDVTIANPATTPVGATQYFALTAQDKDWHNFAARYGFRIKGGFAVREQIAPPAGTTFQKVSDITLDFTGQGHNQSQGIGNIQGTELEKLQTGLTEYAVLRVSVTGCDVTQTKRDESHSVGSIGNRDNIGGSNGTNPNAQINIPETATIGNKVSFKADVLVEDALLHILDGQSHLFVNMWDGNNAGIELWDWK